MSNMDELRYLTEIANDPSLAEAKRRFKKGVKKLKQKSLAPPKKAPPLTKKTVFITRSEEALMTVLGTRVQIKSGKKKGVIEVEYFGDEDLERLLDLFESLKS